MNLLRSKSPSARNKLVQHVRPIIAERVAWALSKRRFSSGFRDIQQEVDDLVQDVLVLLFADNARVISQYDSSRGEFSSWLKTVADHEIASILRRKKRNPWELVLVSTVELAEHPNLRHETDSSVEAADFLHALLERAGPKGSKILCLLLEGLDFSEIETRTQMSRESIYAACSRLRKLAAKIAAGEKK